jgi:FkbH-like protein
MEAKTEEPIRLVIWDLDETFWRGTLTEGGVTEYVEAHHQLVVDLAERGIMSSICSRNALADVRDLLAAKGLWDYFIFPSIDWSAKPARIRAIVEATQLRPQTILFIDDNPSNRAAVEAAIPGIRVAAETFIAEIAAHPHFRGKRDEGLSRLKQYKLLEKRSVEQGQAADAGEFLRASGIRVEIEADLAPHYERIVELINRTNQLNFTKKRLSDDIPTAIAQLKAWLESQTPWVRAGILRVRDNYGDYGYCGFYAQVGDRLEYFCFSCRILGFGVESWLYRMLRDPAIDIEGEVLVDLKTAPAVDWIAVEKLGADAPVSSGANEGLALGLRGRCEVGMLRTYFRFAGFRLTTEGACREGGLELFTDSAVNLYYTSGARFAHTRPALAKLGFAEYRGSRIFEAESPGQPIVVFAHRDFVARPMLYRHKSEDFVVCLALPDYGGDLILSDFADVAAHVHAREPARERAEALLERIAHLRAAYAPVSASGPELGALVRHCLRGLLDELAADGVLMPVLMHPQAKGADGKLWPFRQMSDSRLAMKEALGGDPRVQFLDASACIQSPQEIVDWFHYDRVVYYRMAKIVIDRCRALAAPETAKVA